MKIAKMYEVRPRETLLGSKINAEFESHDLFI